MTEDPARARGISLDRIIRVGKYRIVFLVIFTVTALLVDTMVISKASCLAAHQYDMNHAMLMLKTLKFEIHCILYWLQFRLSQEIQLPTYLALYTTDCATYSGNSSI